jgi:hypothetical protein
MLHQSKPRDLRKNINGKRVPTHVKKRPSLGEVGKGQPLKRRAEFRQRGVNAFRILSVWLNPNVEIFRRAGLRVRGNCMSPHYQIFNVVGVQNGQEFFEVWVHPVPRPSSHTVLE